LKSLQQLILVENRQDEDNVTVAVEMARKFGKDLPLNKIIK
jgi:hypothetical protein